MTQSSDSQIQQLAKSEVQSHYPDVYRGDDDLRNHAFAIAQHQIQDAPGQASKDEFAVQNYAEAYIAAYRLAVEERDAQQ